MKIGILNELIENISFNVRKATFDRKVYSNLANPLKGEELVIKWNEVRNTQASLLMGFDRKAFVDSVEISLGKNTSLTDITVMNNNGILGKHSAETGKMICDKVITIEAGEYTDNIEVALTSDFSDVEIKSVVIYGALFDEKDVFPTPEKISFKGKKIAPEVFSTYCADDCDRQLAAKVLVEKYEEITGVKMKQDNDGAVEFVPDLSIKQDGFKVEVSDGKAIIKASNLRGYVMGAETFIKLCDKDGVTCADIEDAPFCSFRGAHLFLPASNQLDFAKRLIKYLISPMGYNKLIIEVAGGMEFESHPEINEAVTYANNMYKEGKWPKFPHGSVAGGSYISKDETRDYLEYIRSFGIDAIPEIQSLGHVQFMTQAHPDIAEIDADEDELNIDSRVEDLRPDTFYKHSYCPSNPKSYEILFDLMEEIIDVFQPKEYVHMGHDEVYQIGVCKVCREKDPAQLYYNDIMKIHGFLAKKGLKMMIWSDMIQPVSNYTTRPAIDLLPKDILMLDFIWYFHLDDDIETNLLDKGYKVVMGNLYSSHYPRYSTRIRREGMIGGQISAWTETCESKLQMEGKLYDYMLTAQLLWAEAYNRNFTLCYDRIIKNLMPAFRDNLRNTVSPSRIEGAERVVIAENKIDFPPKDAEQNTLIKVDGKFKSLIFSHTELKKFYRLPWHNPDITGKYILTYSDGTTEQIDITNNGIIGHWNRRQNEPVNNPAFRHTGYTSTYYTDCDEFKTSGGEKVCIYNYEHILPEDKTVATVELVQSEEFDTQIFLLKLSGIK